ncbi:MAG TPA: hypothetical protein VFV87_14060 [Pirellulaceae bacterium]|nr:hypothetical protein [Pirellulaceae bacterium]
MARWILAIALVASSHAGPICPVSACPGCNATGATFCEEIAAMDIAAIVRLAKSPPVKAGDVELPKATFEIVQILKGERLVRKGERFDALFFGEAKVGTAFLVMGVGPPKIQWSTPLVLSDRGSEYLREILKLPKDGPERLAFVQSYLEDADEKLASDAYNEFARAPHTDVKALKDRMDHDRLVRWINDPEIPAIRRRLYLLMLGVCGDEGDLPMLEGFLRSKDRQAKAGLDMVISCYLTLKGESGLALVEELFLANTQADYADTYSAIMAIRLQADNFGGIGKPALIKALHPMLQRPELADLVIPDLARWEDWGAIDRLFVLYRDADPKNSWLRVPVINYLRACPLAKAKDLLRECERIDPAAVKRANTFFPVPPSVGNTAG